LPTSECSYAIVLKCSRDAPEGIHRASAIIEVNDQAAIDDVVDFLNQLSTIARRATASGHRLYRWISL